MKMKFVFLTGLTATLLVFQNCSNVNFGSSNDSTTSSSSRLDPSGIAESNDVAGGHFDLDTSTLVYPNAKGSTNHHVHEYDDVNKTNVANFFKLSGAGFDDIPTTIAADQSFYIQIANSDLSPDVALEINGIKYPISTLRHGPYSLSGLAGTTKLTSLRALIATDAILNSGLVSTQTGCVRANDFSADGRYRNGALVIQAIPSDRLNMIDPNLGVASSSAALLWEATLFWHEHGGSCR